MRRSFFTVTIAIMAAIFAISCAKEPVDNYDRDRQIAFEAWVNKYSDGAVKHKSGMFIKKIESTTNPVANGAKYGEWVEINYTMYTVRPGEPLGDIFYTRNKDVAVHMGIFRNYAHYAPSFEAVLHPSDTNSIMVPAIYSAMEDMREGDKWRLYVPSDMGFGGTGSSGKYPQTYGYGITDNQVGVDAPIVIDLELVRVIPNPAKEEKQKVVRYANDVMGLGLNDTVMAGVYYRNLAYSIDTEPVEDSMEIEVLYVGTFMDGFMFDTNIADTALARGQRVMSKTYTPTTTKVSKFYKPDSTEESTTRDQDIVRLPGLNAAFSNMLYGETAEVVMTSTAAFSYTGDDPLTEDGDAAPATVIPPYTPLRFTVTIAPMYGDGTLRFPYITNGVQRGIGNKDGVWVKGFIVGAVYGPTLNDSDMKAGVSTDSNIMIYAKANADISAMSCVAIDLPPGPIREALNLKDYPARFKMEVWVYGNIRNMFGYPGVVDVTAYKLIE